MFIYVYMSVCFTHKEVPVENEDILILHWAGIMSSCDPPNVSPGNWTQALCKKSKYS